MQAKRAQGDFLNPGGDMSFDRKPVPRRLQQVSLGFHGGTRRCTSMQQKPELLGLTADPVPKLAHRRLAVAQRRLAGHAWPYDEVGECENVPCFIYYFILIRGFEVESTCCA